jgi:hypothetical protein
VLLLSVVLLILLGLVIVVFCEWPGLVAGERLGRGAGEVDVTLCNAVGERGVDVLQAHVHLFARFL